MAILNVSVTDPMRAWVEAQVEGGMYANNSDYVRDLIRKDQERAEKFRALKAAIAEGLASGEPQDLDMQSFKKTLKESLKDARV